MFLLIAWAGWREAKNIVFHLREEAEMGVITIAQYRTASSMIGRWLAGLSGIFTPQPFATPQFYQICGELAHKKEQLRKHGEEGGNSALIVKYRENLRQLSPHARA